MAGDRIRRSQCDSFAGSEVGHPHTRRSCRIPVIDHMRSLRMDAGLKIDPVPRRDFFDAAVGIPGLDIRIELKLGGPHQQNRRNQDADETQPSFCLHLRLFPMLLY
jgi:hypothetical protein